MGWASLSIYTFAPQDSRDGSCLFHTDHPFAHPLQEKRILICGLTGGVQKPFRNSSLPESLQALLTFAWPLPSSKSIPGTFHCSGPLCHSSAAWVSLMHLKYPLWPLGKRKLKRMALTGHQRYKGPLYPRDISAFGAVFYLFKWLLLEPLSTPLCQRSTDF